MLVKNDKAYKCNKCNRVTYPKRMVCLKCGASDFCEIPFEDEATLLTFTSIYQLPAGIDDRFLTIGVCQFPSGVKAMGRITSPDVKAGMKLKASYQFIRQINGEDVSGFIFEPTK